nr:BTB/POZ and MATH domain-containing protein 2-like [Tanacetum cinerariifolium]
MEILPESTSNSSVVGSDDGVITSFQLSQNSRPPMLDHQDKYMMKAQVHVSKSSAISDVQPLPRRKHYCQIYQVVKHMLRGRLLARFQDHEHEGGDTRSHDTKLSFDVAFIIDKMREGRLIWFGHVKRRPQTAPVRRVEALLVDRSRIRGRPKLRWEDRLNQDMKELLLFEHMTSDRNAPICFSCAVSFVLLPFTVWLVCFVVFVCVVVPLWDPSCLGPHSFSIYSSPSDISQHFSHLLETVELTNVNLKVDEEVFRAHKLVLAARLTIFKAHLFGPIKDINIDSIEVHEIEPSDFKRDNPRSLNVTVGGIFLYKTPNQAYQLLEDKVLLKLDWAKNKKTKSSLKKTIAFADERNSNSNTDKIIARMDAMTIKMDAQYKELQSRAKQTTPDLNEDDMPMSRIFKKSSSNHLSQSFLDGGINGVEEVAIMSSDSHATITYTSMSSYEVIVNGYFGMPMDPLDPYVQLIMEAPPSLDYIPGPEVPPSPDYILEPEAPPLPDYIPGPEAPPSPDYIPGPEYPEYLPPADDVLPVEEQPLPAAVSPTAESPGYIMDSEPEMEPEKEDGDDEKSEEDSIEYPTSERDDDDDDLSEDDVDDEDEEESSDSEEEEKEHLAPTVPVLALHSSIPASEDSDETEPFMEGEIAATPPPFGYRVAARISVQPHILMPFCSESEVERLLAIPTPPLSLVSPTSYPLPPFLMPLPIFTPLPTSSFSLPLSLLSTSGSESIPEADIPLQKRARFTTPTDHGLLPVTRGSYQYISESD